MADSIKLNRYNRVRAITIEANLKDGLALGDALAYLDRLVRESLPGKVIVDYKGQSQDFRSAGESILFVLVLSVLSSSTSCLPPSSRAGYIRS